MSAHHSGPLLSLSTCEPPTASDSSAPLRRAEHPGPPCPGQSPPDDRNPRQADDNHPIPAPGGSEWEDRADRQVITRQTVSETPKDGQSGGSTEVKPDLRTQESGDHARCRRLNDAPPTTGCSRPIPRTWNYTSLHGKGSLQMLGG